MTLTDEAKQLIGNMGYDPTYGARPLRRVIQKQLTDRLALALLQGEIGEGDTVTVDAAEGELVLETSSSSPPATVRPGLRRRRGRPGLTLPGGSRFRRCCCVTLPDLDRLDLQVPRA